MTDFVPTLAQADELHHRIAPSQAAYNLIHGHCVVVATITRQLVQRQNALFVRRCTLPAGAQGDAVPATDGVSGGQMPPRLLDESLAVVGAMLHDIGTYLVLANDGTDGQELKFDGPNYVLHGLRGYRWLLEQGVDESVAQFARNHTGVGLTREQVEAQGLPLPVDDYVPMNLEQEVVMVADKYNSKSIPPRFLTAQAYARKAARFGEANERQWLDLVRQYGTPDIPALAARFNMQLEQ